MKKKRALSRNIRDLLILSAVTIFIWIGADVYRALQGPIEIDVPKEQLKALIPGFDRETIEALKKRQIISQQDINSVPELTDFQLTKPETKKASPSATAKTKPLSEEASPSAVLKEQ